MHHFTFPHEQGLFPLLIEGVLKDGPNFCLSHVLAYSTSASSCYTCDAIETKLYVNCKIVCS